MERFTGLLAGDFLTLVRELKRKISREKSLDLEKVKPGDSIQVDFYSDSTRPDGYPSLSLEVLKPAIRGEVFFEAIASGGPFGWDNKLARVGGSVFYPKGPLQVSRITPSLLLEMRVREEGGESETARLLRQNVNFQKMPERERTDILEGLKWKIVYSPPVAGFKLPSSKGR